MRKQDIIATIGAKAISDTQKVKIEKFKKVFNDGYDVLIEANYLFENIYINKQKKDVIMYKTKKKYK